MCNNMSLQHKVGPLRNTRYSYPTAILVHTYIHTYTALLSIQDGVKIQVFEGLDRIEGIHIYLIKECLEVAWVV